jgi:hypothetical protein
MVDVARLSVSQMLARKVSASSLSANFLVLVPNLTVRDRVSGQPRGDGLDPTGEHNLYEFRGRSAGVPRGVPTERAGA